MTADARKALLGALAHLEHGDWQAAHLIVQPLDSPDGCWIHGIVHLMEGDLDNARYWYRRANRAFSDEIGVELTAVRLALQ